MAYVEYSKILRWNVTPTSRGIQATVSLPSAGSIKIPKYGGFVTYYVAIKFGSISYECGFSIDFYGAPKDQWRWTSASSDPQEADSGLRGVPGEFTSGNTIQIKLTLDNAPNPSSGKKKLEFYVGPNLVRTFARDFDSTANLTEARLIIAANHETYSDTAVPNPLPSWGVLHNQVTVNNIMYKNTSNTWVAVSSSNSTPPTSTEKNPSYRQHQGSPLNYSMTVLPASSMIYASLKI